MRAVHAAVAAGLLLRLAFGLGYWTGKPLTHDEREYLTLAANVAQGRGFATDAAGRDAAEGGVANKRAALRPRARLSRVPGAADVAGRRPPRRPAASRRAGGGENRPGDPRRGGDPRARGPGAARRRRPRRRRRRLDRRAVPAAGVDAGLRLERAARLGPGAGMRRLARRRDRWPAGRARRPRRRHARARGRRRSPPASAR